MKEKIIEKYITKNLVPIVVCVVVLAIHFIPGLAQALQLDVEAVSGGNLWLVFSGHFTHWSFSHLFWDLLMFGGLGVLCYNYKRSCYWSLLFFGCMGVSLAVMQFCPQISLYRGLSGLDSALFIFIAAAGIEKALQRHDSIMLLGGVLMLVLFIGKTIFEIITGNTLFVVSNSFTPLPLSHLAGMAVGIVVFLANYFVNVIRLKALRQVAFSS